MNLIAIFAGLIWGTLAAFINSRIASNAMGKTDARSAAKVRRLQTLVDIAALAAIVLLRDILPFSYEIALVSAIISMSVLTIVLLFVINGKRG